MSSVPPEVPPETLSGVLAHARGPLIDRQAFEQRTQAHLEQRLAAIGVSPEIPPRALMDLAWDCFLAGATAGAQVERDEDEEGSPFDTSDPLAEMVAALSPRRFEVLQLVARGLTNREVGEILGISSHTVKSHMTGLFESLDVTNRTEAAFALQRYDEVYSEDRSA